MAVIGGVGIINLHFDGTSLRRIEASSRRGWTNPFPLTCLLRTLDRSAAVDLQSTACEKFAVSEGSWQEAVYDPDVPGETVGKRDSMGRMGEKMSAGNINGNNSTIATHSFCATPKSREVRAKMELSSQRIRPTALIDRSVPTN